jgi:hypothetical protein
MQSARGAKPKGSSELRQIQRVTSSASFHVCPFCRHSPATDTSSVLRFMVRNYSASSANKQIAECLPSGSKAVILNVFQSHDWFLQFNRPPRYASSLSAGRRRRGDRFSSRKTSRNRQRFCRSAKEIAASASARVCVPLRGCVHALGANHPAQRGPEIFLCRVPAQASS